MCLAALFNKQERNQKLFFVPVHIINPFIRDLLLIFMLFLKNIVVDVFSDGVCVADFILGIREGISDYDKRFMIRFTNYPKNFIGELAEIMTDTNDKVKCLIMIKFLFNYTHIYHFRL